MEVSETESNPGKWNHCYIQANAHAYNKLLKLTPNQSSIIKRNVNVRLSECSAKTKLYRYIEQSSYRLLNCAKR